MTRVHEAQEILRALGFDQERSNERSALTLLALTDVRPDRGWSEATNEMYGTRALMDFIRDVYDVTYAANTRETIRRFTLHQFADALLVEQNRDQPDRPVNSPKWNYAVHPTAPWTPRGTASCPSCSPGAPPAWCSSPASRTGRRCGSTSPTSPGRPRCGAPMRRATWCTSTANGSSVLIGERGPDNPCPVPPAEGPLPLAARHRCPGRCREPAASGVRERILR